MIKGLERRFLLTFLVITAGFLALLGIILVVGINRYNEAANRNSIEAMARVLAAEIKHRAPLPGEDGVFPDVTRSVAEALGGRVVIVGPEGKVWGDSAPDTEGLDDPNRWPEFKSAFQGRVAEDTRTGPGGEKTFYRAFPVEKAGEVVAVIRFSLPVDRLYGGATRLWTVMGVAFSLIFVINGALAHFLARGIIEPLKEITEVARDMAKGQFHRRAGVPSPDEIGTLAQSINYMGARLRFTFAAISEEKNKLEAVLTSMTEGVIAIDREGHVLFLNPAVESMFGFRMPGDGAKHFIEVIRNYELEQVLRRSLEEESYGVHEMSLIGRALRIYLAPLRNENKTVGVVAILRDITELRSFERMRSEFVANVSHELRTPLTSIKGFAETLADGAVDNPKTARRFLSIIGEETERLTRLIDDILSLSHMEARDTNMNYIPLNIGQIAESTVSILSSKAYEKEMRITLDIPSDLPPVDGDRDMMNQVFLNLVDNAIKYTLPTGTVKISARLEGDLVECSVADTGIGIPEESLGRIFERFFRVDKARSRSLGGTGLGLAIVKHILELHHGSIDVASTEGRGTTFTFRLPIKQHE